jgi:hypothetical protein
MCRAQKAIKGLGDLEVTAAAYADAGVFKLTGATL